MPYFKCLECGHRIFKQKVDEGELIQCTNYKCRGCWVIPEERYEAIISDLMDIVEDDTPVLDTFFGIITVLQNNGIRGRPLRTLKVASNLVAEAERRKRTAKRGEL